VVRNRNLGGQALMSVGPVRPRSATWLILCGPEPDLRDQLARPDHPRAGATHREHALYHRVPPHALPHRRLS
jgi:hypothetical protein